MGSMWVLIGTEREDLPRLAVDSHLFGEPRLHGRFRLVAEILRHHDGGKIGVLCLAPEEGAGVDDPELRERVGEDRITLFRRHGA